MSRKSSAVNFDGSERLTGATRAVIVKIVSVVCVGGLRDFAMVWMMDADAACLIMSDRLIGAVLTKLWSLCCCWVEILLR